MRPPAKQQSALRNPLNGMLGTETNVRILRILAAAAVPIGKAELARQAGLNQTGVRRALKELVKFGIVEDVGSAPRKLVELRTRHTLSSAIRDLFISEAERFQEIVASLGELMASVQPPPRSAWIQGPIAKASDQPGDPVVVGVLTSTRAAALTRQQLMSALPRVMNDPDVRVEFLVVTQADLEAYPDLEEQLDDSILLVAPHPSQLLEGAKMGRNVETKRSHDQLDQQALALANAIAQRITEDPGLISRTAASLRQRLERASPGEQHELGEWLALLENRATHQIVSLLLDPSESGTRLRQSLPFLDVLTKEERDKITEKASDDS